MKKLIKSICFSFLAFMFAIGSIFLPVGKQNIDNASAVDNTTYNYSFQSSGFYGVLNHYEYSGSIDRQELCFFSNSFSYDSSYNRILLSPSFIATLGGLNNPLDLSYPYTYFNDFYNSNVYQNVVPLDTPNFDYAIFVAQSSYNATNVIACYHMRVYFTTGFNCNVYKVDIFIDNFSSSSDMLVFKYFDVNNNYLQISYMIPRGYDFGARTYYFTNPTALSDNQAYLQGKTDGLIEGEAIGRSEGYSEGQSAGYLSGKQDGYNEGAEDANQYTFLKLMGAVVDAPLSVFSSMFDFDLLGVNLRDFFFAILTFCFLTILVKFALMKG